MLVFYPFVICTILYMIVRGIGIDTHKNRNNTSQFLWNAATLCYFIVVVVIQMKSNYTSIKEICVSVRWGDIFKWTILTNILIFAPLIILLKNFSGWKAPFANTIGYAIVQLAGLKGLLNSILKQPKDVEDKSNSDLIKTINLVYNDPSEIINDITPTNWDKWIEKTEVTSLFKDPATLKKERKKPLDDQLEKLYGFVVARDLIAEFIWLIMTGFYIYSLQVNSLANLRCIRPSNKIEVSTKEEGEDDEKLQYISE